MGQLQEVPSFCQERVVLWLFSCYLMAEGLGNEGEGEGREREGRGEGEGEKWEEGNRMLVYERKGIMCMRTHAHAHTHTHTPYVLQSVAAVR